MSTDPDRELLFGLVALHNDLIDADQLVNATKAWIRDRSCGLADQMVAGGDLRPRDREAIATLAARYLDRNANDSGRALASFPAMPEVRDRLAALQDQTLSLTISHMATSDAEADATLHSARRDRQDTAFPDRRRFRILRPHARGGLGAVFVALDLELNREVALKQILEAHAANLASRERFVLEAEVTGSLEHPGIVPVYGLGADDKGRPFYAMRFIRGDNLTDAIARFHDSDAKADPGARALALQKLLRRFLDVCNAIDYAHGRGVLHRDIKPGNIVVGKYGETLVVDWGLAKVRRTSDGAAAREEGVLAPAALRDATETVVGSTLGTPAYMSPEQARGDLGALGPASDVYSLGATLYCLLTGKSPFAGDVRSVLDAVVHGRFARPRRLDPAIDRALEGVCLHAMALAPGDRYPTVRALADDIERWLADEPVTAVREPWRTRLRRWGRRHRTAASSVGVGLATVFAALVISTVLINRERAKAEANFQKARAAVDTYFTTVSESKLLEVPGLQVLRKELLDAALEYYRDFLREHGDDVSVRKESAAATFRVGWINQQIGDASDAIEPYRAATTLYEALVQAEPGVAEHRRQLALCHNAMAAALGRLNRTEEAVAYYRKALDILLELAQADRANAMALDDIMQTRSNMGSYLRMLGRLDEALAQLDSAATIGTELLAMPLETVPAREDLMRESDAWSNVREDLARVQLRRIQFLWEAERLAEADTAWWQCHELCEELLKKSPSSLRFQSLFASGDLAGAKLLIREERLAEARETLEHGSTILEGLVAGNPSVLQYRDVLGETQFNLGTVLSRLGKTAEALEATRRCIDTLDKALALEPASANRRTLRVRALKQYGELLLGQGRKAEALAMLRRARATQEEIARSQPESIYHATTLADLLYALGSATADREEARDAYAGAAEISGRWAPAYPQYWFNQAEFLALSIPLSAPAQRESLALATMDALRQALATDSVELEGLATDADFRVLHGRADFAELLEDVRKSEVR